MRLALAKILPLLLFSLLVAPCEGIAACHASEHLSIAQAFPWLKVESHCCQGAPAGEGQDGHCPPSCHCACCHAPAVPGEAAKKSLPPFAPEPAQPEMAASHYQSDFYHLIWHPPQAG